MLKRAKMSKRASLKPAIRRYTNALRALMETVITSARQPGTSFTPLKKVLKVPGPQSVKNAPKVPAELPKLMQVSDRILHTLRSTREPCTGAQLLRAAKDTRGRYLYAMRGLKSAGHVQQNGRTRAATYALTPSGRRAAA